MTRGESLLRINTNQPNHTTQKTQIVKSRPVNFEHLGRGGGGGSGKLFPLPTGVGEWW
jgi:hypothetical protein